MRFFLRTFVCPHCTAKMIFPKRRRQTPNGHKKWAYCPTCKRKRNMEQTATEIVRC